MENKKMISIGEKIYDNFVEKITNKPVLTPTTQSLELFGVLDKYGEVNLLKREMLEELLKNFEDIKVFVENGELYYEDIIHKKWNNPPL